MYKSLVRRYADQWRTTGLQEGDIVLLHSALKRTVLRDRVNLRGVDVAEMIHTSFLEVLGPTGTLVYPTFNFDFSNGLQYDISSTPSSMGSLSELARIYAEFRTGHPVYSFVAFGARKDLFSGIDNFSAYGVHSPFAVLHNVNAKIAVLNLPDQNSMTFYHHVEEMLGCDYRYHKSFTNVYVDSLGRALKPTYSIFVRDTSRGVVTHVDPMGEILWAKGIYKGDRFSEGSGLRWANAIEIFEETARVIKDGRARGLLFEINQ